jgi:hypothetical protein
LQEEKDKEDKVISVFCGLVRHEKIFLGSNPIEKSSAYQTVEIIKG